jgi:hypothetical protein
MPPRWAFSNNWACAVREFRSVRETGWPAGTCAIDDNAAERSAIAVFMERSAYQEWRGTELVTVTTSAFP